MAAAAFAEMKNVKPKDFSEYSHLNRCEKKKENFRFTFLFFVF